MPLGRGPGHRSGALVGHAAGRRGRSCPDRREGDSREPNRFNGIYGAARAAELGGDAAKAKRQYSQLVSLAAQSDTERPELAQAKAFLAKN